MIIQNFKGKLVINAIYQQTDETLILCRSRDPTSLLATISKLALEISWLIILFRITDDIKIFCVQEFLPEFRSITNNETIPQEEFLKFEGNAVSTVIKLLYAFLWQVNFSWFFPKFSSLRIWNSFVSNYDAFTVRSDCWV